MLLAFFFPTFKQYFYPSESPAILVIKKKKCMLVIAASVEAKFRVIPWGQVDPYLNGKWINNYRWVNMNL